MSTDRKLRHDTKMSGNVSRRSNDEVLQPQLAVPTGNPRGISALRQPPLSTTAVRLRRARINLLQRQLGNRHVARAIVHRQDTPASNVSQPADALSPGMFDVQDAQLLSDGNIIAQPTGHDQVTVSAPNITFNASVGLQPDAHLAPDMPVRVGPVQTLLGSDRTGIYRRGGAPDGEIIAEQHAQTGQTRDAQWKEGRHGPEATVEAPWYSSPSVLSETHRQATVSYRDQPSIDLPRSVGDGQLAETRGSDHFVTSLTAKREDQLIHLQSSQWDVPWNVTIGPDQRGVGGSIAPSSIADGPPTIDGPISMAAAEEWVSFNSIDAAMSASNEVLLNNLVPAKQHDPTSWGYIAEALRRKNPSVELTLNVVKTAEMFGGDEIKVTLQGHQAIARGPFSLNDGQSASLSVALTDLFDPLAITATTTIEIRAQDVGFLSNSAATMSWAYPFYAQLTPAPMLRGGDERYTITGSIR
jgi:hypothetical protein